jgi:glutamyl-tRNA reductase
LTFTINLHLRPTNHFFQLQIPDRFFVAGVNFKKTDVAYRSRFALSPDQCKQMYLNNNSFCLQYFFILSTCNRTEIYGFAPCEYIVTGLLQQHAGCTEEEPKESVYCKEGNDAVTHFFRVAAGLDSQIPGDYEIVGQIKSAFSLAKENNCTNGYLEKLFNFALQASKEIKNSTSFSDGTVSVPYTAVKSLSQQQNIKKIVVLGAGTTAELCISHLSKLLPTATVTVVNRSLSRAESFATQFGAQSDALNNLADVLKSADALLVTTSAHEPLVKTAMLSTSSVKYIYDLSVPANVEVSARTLSTLTYLDVDRISSEVRLTMDTRLQQVPQVEKIIDAFLKDFNAWSYRHQYFRVAATLQGETDSISSKVLAKIFESSNVKDDAVHSHPYSKHFVQTVKNTLLLAFPEWKANEETQTYPANACTSIGHAQQPPCFMANRCCRAWTNPVG